MKEKSKVLKGMSAYLKYVWEEKRSIFLMGIIFFPAYITANFLQLYLPKMVIKELGGEKSVTYLGMSLLCLIVLLMVCIIIRGKMLAQIRYSNRLLVQKMQNGYSQKLLDIDYKYLEDKDFLSVRNKVKESLFQGTVGDEWAMAKLADFMETLVTLTAITGNIVLYAFYLHRLSPLLDIILVIAPLLILLASKTVSSYEEKYAGDASDAWQKLDYVTRKTEDFTMAKDIRMYQMGGWLSGLIDKFCKERLTLKAKELWARGIVEVISVMVYGVYYVCFFAFILFRFPEGSISVSDLVFYANMGPGLYFLVNRDFYNNIRRFLQVSVQFARYKEFKEYGEDTGDERMPVKKEAPVISLEHVSFSYPGMETEVLKDINLTINKGEKIAIVGVNGAGKSTLMKLVCGLLHPTGGRILLNGVDMEHMDAEERYSWFSCAFQDIQFLPLSIRENISMENVSMELNDGSNVYDDRIWQCLEEAGIGDGIYSLPLKLDTLMEKSLNEDAVDFSGGQKQKIILARALYRDAGVLVLDEPTAALDALAENDIYEKYSEFSNKKTSFFVSHRLSSTRFCDRILLLDGGKIAEEGTHGELLSAGGLYAKMFEMQSKYYKEGEA